MSFHGPLFPPWSMSFHHLRCPSKLSFPVCILHHFATLCASSIALAFHNVLIEQSVLPKCSVPSFGVPRNRHNGCRSGGASTSGAATPPRALHGCVVQGHLRGPWRPVLSGAAVYHAILPGKSETVMKRVLHVSSWTFCSMWWCFTLFNLILVWKPTSLTIFFATWSRPVSSSDTALAQIFFWHNLSFQESDAFCTRRSRDVCVCAWKMYTVNSYINLYYMIVIWSYKPGSRILFVSLGGRSSGIKQTLTSKAMPGGECSVWSTVSNLSMDVSWHNLQDWPN